MELNGEKKKPYQESKIEPECFGCFNLEEALYDCDKCCFSEACKYKWEIAVHVHWSEKPEEEDELTEEDLKERRKRKREAEAKKMIKLDQFIQQKRGN